MSPADAWKRIRLAENQGVILTIKQLASQDHHIGHFRAMKTTISAIAIKIDLVTEVWLYWS